jgi:threonine/homoserine/homoserine lactone efflux protein
MNFPVAFAIGFSVASIPGPTILLILAQTLTNGAKAGLATMAAPMMLDAVLMLPLGLFLQTALLPEGGGTLLGLGGAALLFLIGAKSLVVGLRAKTTKDPATAIEKHPFSAFLKGAAVHLTSPYPYLYWSSIGAALVRQGYETGGPLAATIFPLGFWSGAGAFSLIVIYLASRGRRLIPPAFENVLHLFAGSALVASSLYVALKIWRHGY